MRHRGDNPLLIGVLNNMTGPARRAASLRFTRLLRMQVNIAIEIRLFAAAGGDADHHDLAALFETPLDGLIVTGAEPQAARLEDEPVWATLANTVDWVEEHAIPTVWSCLAAHAAVRYIDGVARVQLARKRSGLFVCRRMAGPDPLLHGMPATWVCPHSRQNDLLEFDLAQAGYQILSRTEHGDVDLFVKRRSAVNLFCQGHPEYRPDTLMMEYRRDVLRHLNGERASPPALPEHLSGNWQQAASQLYANWIDHVAASGVRGNETPRRIPAVAAPAGADLP